MGEQALLATFRSKVEPLGVTVARASDRAAAAGIIAALAVSLGAGTPVASGELIAAAPELTAALTAAGCPVRAPRSLSETRDAPLGLSLGRLAIAETGSLLLAEPSLGDRAVGLMTLAHLVICPMENLVASLNDAVEHLRAVTSQPGGGYATFVTGPSRTADIEGQLTVGVQGPGRLFVLFVAEMR